MDFFLILPYYFKWHYSQALVDIKNIWKNFLVFVYNFFSVPTLLFSLFSPWQRMQEGLPKGFGLEEAFGMIVVNTLMRLVGAFVRSIFIVIGTVSLVLCLCFGIIVYCFWIVLPVVVIYTFGQGMLLLFS